MVYSTIYKGGADMKTGRFFIVAIMGLMMLSLTLSKAQAACTHNWVFQNIFKIVDTGSDSTHRIDGQQRCTKCGATRYASTYEAHNYYYNWYCYYKYSATQHEFKQDYICRTCNHKKVVSTLQNHQWESIYDTYCDLCGQTR